VAKVVDEELPGGLKAAVRNEVNSILAGEPNVQRAFKRNHRLLLERDASWWEKQCEIGWRPSLGPRFAHRAGGHSPSRKAQAQLGGQLNEEESA